MINTKFLKLAKESKKQAKQNAENTAKLNLNKALLNEEFKNLYYKEKEEIIENARKQAFGEKTDLSNYNQIINLQKQVLQTMNMTLEDLKPQYSCKICKDTGLDENFEYCQCVKKIVGDYLLANCGKTYVDRSFKDCDFTKFSEENRETIKVFYKKMQQWCKKDDSKIKNIIICGYTGVGKTFLLECMLSELLENNKTALFTTAFNLNQSFLKYHTTFDDNKLEFLEPYLYANTLLIDDLGTEPILKNVTLEYLLVVINQRAIEGKSTVITTNLDINQLMDRYGERITSRLINKQNSITFNIKNTEDLRLKK